MPHQSRCGSGGFDRLGNQLKIEGCARSRTLSDACVGLHPLSGNGGDPIVTFNQFMIAYGGKDFITPDGKLHPDDPKVRQAAVKGLVKLTTPYTQGYVPPGVVSWNDADDNNAFHSKLMVMDFDGSISTELALYNSKEEYDQP